MINPNDSHEIEAKFEIDENTFKELSEIFLKIGSPSENFGRDDFYLLPGGGILRFRHREHGEEINCELTIKKLIKPPYVRRENEICFPVPREDGTQPVENFIRDLGGKYLVTIEKGGVNLDLEWLEINFWLTCYQARNPASGEEKYFFEIEVSKEVSIKSSVEESEWVLGKFVNYFIKKQNLEGKLNPCDKLLYQFFVDI